MLSEEQIRFFQEHGYLIVGRVLDDAEVAALRSHAEWIASGQADHIPAA
ncbi:MAG: phytanoyl-CoA dioxygenase family protein, partial [Armatimonadetes bacterium]|nr:phytanoyl-CoA dioxygenase family protein [Armatimonadota bacterium]